MKNVALPTEHGAWGFLFEPIVASLAIAFSATGVWIAIMTIGAFLARQPLKIFLLNRQGRKDAELSAASIKFGALYGSIFVIGLAATLATAGVTPLVPFLVVTPLMAVQFYFDAFRKGRQLIPELAGAVAISASAAAIAIAGGFQMPAAVAIWLVFIARLIPSILYVRQRLRLEKGKTCFRTGPLVSQAVGLTIVGFMAFVRLIPILPVFAMSILSLRAIEGLSSGRRKMKAMKIGIWEVIYGTLTVVSMIVGYYAGL